MDTNITQKYFKQRKDFGRQLMFCEVAPHMLDSINPNSIDQKQYCLRNPVNREAQISTSVSENYINTKQIFLRATGINHDEGGWPKDIHYDDEEATSRYRRRFERDDGYVDAIKNLNPEFEHYIKQNNAIEMYNMYFKEITSEKPVEKFSIKINSTYKDYDSRPVSDICWTYEDKPKLAVSYCDKAYPVLQVRNNNFICYVWDIENPSEPYLRLYPQAACWQLVSSPASPDMFIGGLANGKVCIFDIRAQSEAVQISPEHLAHRDPVSSLLFIPSRLNTEFFSGSTDGLCLWWDVRNISKATESLLMSIRVPFGETSNFTNSEGVSALQYDRSFPTKFLCGTDTGLVICVNRKGKSHNEIMSAVFNAHSGPVKAVYRSPCTSKVFITCGDWKVNVWNEDVRSSPIITGMPHQYQINDVVWAPKRYSGYMSVSSDGKFRYWDLLRKYQDPLAVMPVSQHALLKIKPNEDGQFVAIGDSKGLLNLLSLSELLVISDESDKQLMNQTFDRETRREHILETRVKEIRLKLKAEEEKKDDTEVDVVNEDTLLASMEEEYRRIVSDEWRKIGTTPIMRDVKKMRKR